MQQIEELILKLYEGLSLRGVRDALSERGHRVCHETVRNVLRAHGRLRTRGEAAKRRRVYPREWMCHVCKTTRMVDDHKSYRRQTCSQECANKLRRLR